MFRPSALKISNSNSNADIENLVYNTEFTLGFHFFISIAIACLTWLLVVKPSMQLGTRIGKLFSFFLFIIIPIVCLSTNVLNDSIASRTDTIFMYAKYITMWGSISVLIIFLLMSIHKPNFLTSNITTITFGVILVINILEAAFDQMINGSEKNIDITNGLIGLILAGIVIYVAYKNRSDVKIENGYLNFYIPLTIILAYTTWNLLFRSYLLQNTSTLLYFIASLLMPIIANYYYPNSWLHVRAISLFFYMTIVLGISKDQARLLPLYNEQGYIENSDKQSPLSQIQTELWYKVIMLTLSCFFILCYVLGADKFLSK